jgi:hypothetical protein
MNVAGGRRSETDADLGHITMVAKRIVRSDERPSCYRKTSKNVAARQLR